jgi:hypothetical protein
MSRFFILTAAIEAGAGLGLLAAPDMATKLLLAADIAGAAIPVARIAGVALLALGVASWLARDRETSALVSAMLLYNCGVALILAIAGLSGMAGVLLWPAVAMHIAMAVWSAFTLRSPS